MNLSDFMVAEAFVPQLDAADRDGIIRELVHALADAGRIPADKVDEIATKVIDRENQGSTGIGKGIAVPHVKHPAIDQIVGTVGCSKEGVDFRSLDKAPVYSVLLLLSPPNNPDQHLEAMENLFAHLQKEMFRKFLRQADTTDAIVELLAEADEAKEKSGL